MKTTTTTTATTKLIAALNILKREYFARHADLGDYFDLCEVRMHPNQSACLCSVETAGEIQEHIISLSDICEIFADAGYFRNYPEDADSIFLQNFEEEYIYNGEAVQVLGAAFRTQIVGAAWNRWIDSSGFDTAHLIETQPFGLLRTIAKAAVEFHHRPAQGGFPSEALTFAFGEEFLPY